MRRLVLKMEISIDGFAGARDGDVRWIDPSYDAGLTACEVDLLAGAGAHLMGRRAYTRTCRRTGRPPTSRSPPR